MRVVELRPFIEFTMMGSASHRQRHTVGSVDAPCFSLSTFHSIKDFRQIRSWKRVGVVTAGKVFFFSQVHTLFPRGRSSNPSTGVATKYMTRHILPHTNAITLQKYLINLTLARLLIEFRFRFQQQKLQIIQDEKFPILPFQEVWKLLLLRLLYFV